MMTFKISLEMFEEEEEILLVALEQYMKSNRDDNSAEYKTKIESLYFCFERALRKKVKVI